MSESTKEMLSQGIRTWAQYERDISAMKQEMKTQKTAQKQIMHEMIEIMKRENLTNLTNAQNETVEYVRHVTHRQPSAKELKRMLHDFFENDAAKAEELAKFISDGRREVVREFLRHK